MNEPIHIEYRGEKVTLIATDQLIDRILDAIYPDKGVRGQSKGYIELVNFFFGKRE